MRRTGPLNSITDVPSIMVGCHTDPEVLTGATVVLAVAGGVGGVDVRGSAPGTRETDLLDPVNLIERVDAVALCGGSAYGLAAADGVMRYLEERGIGHPVGEGKVVPIVPAAVIFDLGRGKKPGHIGEDAGYHAAYHASASAVELGNHGAGTGAISGGFRGGLGSASETFDNGITIGAIAVVNSTGSAFDRETGAFYARHLEIGDEFGGLRRDLSVGNPDYHQLLGEPGAHTTIGVVATDAILTKAQATKVAMMAQDGIARAIYPCHTMVDGDTLFCIATGRTQLPIEETRYSRSTARALNLLGASAADAVARSIVRAVLSAEGITNYKSYRDAFPNWSTVKEEQGPSARNS
ncbi:MAG: P1 family peptidase [Candidatus Bathyarchaeia archaeon]